MAMQAEAFHPEEVIGQHKMRTRILVVEDEALFARAVVKRLKRAGYDCEHADTLADGRALARQFMPDLALLDMRLPDGNGLELLAELAGKGVSAIVMTAHGDLSDAVNAMKQGAADYLKKPVDLEELLLAIQKVEATARLKHQLDYSRQRNTHTVTEGHEFLGDSQAMRIARAQIERVANLVPVGEAVSPTVLIQGETGTGKDVAARLLHVSTAKSDRPFVHVDCASLPAELIESELFGHEKGAFTNAQASRCGLIEAAEDGTLFLDEIGELPLNLQAKLLNVLERRVVRRVGSTRERPVPARFIAATNRDLQKMAQEGTFRSDLYYRLNVLTITLPPLRERQDDVLMLARHFAAQTERRYGLVRQDFSEDALAALKSYSWPGNVRELRHQVSRAIMLSREGIITAADLALPDSSGREAAEPRGSGTLDGRLTLDQAEKMLIENALEVSNYNVSEAARHLGITRMAMRYRMEKHGLKPV